MPSNKTHKTPAVTSHTRFNPGPSRAFRAIVKRIEWLNWKITDHEDAGRRFDYYLEEREALIWSMDKIKKQAEIILDLMDEVNGLEKELDSLVDTDTDDNDMPSNEGPDGGDLYYDPPDDFWFDDGRDEDELVNEEPVDFWYKD